MPKALELRKVIEILRSYGIEFDSKSGGRLRENSSEAADHFMYAIPSGF